MGDIQTDNKRSTLAYGATLTIDLDAIVENYRTLVAMVTPAQCSAIVKADAYGLGAKHVAPALYDAGCRFFFVAELVEAFELQKVLAKDAEIAVLNGILPGAEEMAAQAKIIPVLNSWDAILRWQQLCRRQTERLGAIVQIDTGMSRLGLDENELQNLIDDPSVFHDADIKLAISHLAMSDEEKSAKNPAQLVAMKKALLKLPPCKVAFSASGGIFLGGDYHFDMVRPGIALYGVDPLGKSQTTIKPVLQLQARVIQSRHVKQGVSIGYGGTFRTRRDSTITTISVGYADGWLRALGNKGSVFFNGKRLAIIGRVSMDSITLDTTDLGENAPKPGDFVELIGKHQSLENVARDAGTIAYEILTSLSHRYERIYLKHNKGDAK
ncbi:alanine racemase [uncultured Bartonella sp.]|uniref:alanine racemase n=1 Tax=uncultured Bartonella sp. TaxID=104108 RepID=UPI002625542A|nr:alanine racemase [uncultured Bartonella sp.]